MVETTGWSSRRSSKVTASQRLQNDEHNVERLCDLDGIKNVNLNSLEFQGNQDTNGRSRLIKVYLNANSRIPDKYEFQQLNDLDHRMHALKFNDDEARRYSAQGKENNMNR